MNMTGIFDYLSKVPAPLPVTKEDKESRNKALEDLENEIESLKKEAGDSVTSGERGQEIDDDEFGDIEIKVVPKELEKPTQQKTKNSAQQSKVAKKPKKETITEAKRND